jgi:hypothetical protein
MEIHHKIPWYKGGTDDIENLELVSKEEHKQRHLNLYEKYGDYRDLCAYHMIGYNFTDAHKISSSQGGKLGGQKVKDLKLGICGIAGKERSQIASMGGKLGAASQIKNKIGIHGQTPEERNNFNKQGREKQKEIGGGFYNSELQRENGKRGGPKNKGFRWYFDGTTNQKYTPKMQLDSPFEEFMKDHPEYNKGRQK